VTPAEYVSSLERTGVTDPGYNEARSA
jgi:hypothetical protein